MNILIDREIEMWQNGQRHSKEENMNKALEHNFMPNWNDIYNLLYAFHVLDKLLPNLWHTPKMSDWLSEQLDKLKAHAVG